MNFVSNRNITVRSAKTGMAIKFIKGDPTYVPPKMHQEVMEKGILPVDEKGAAVDPHTHDAGLAQEPRVLLAPDDGDEREVKILEVINALVKRNNPTDFTGGGMPSAKSITAALGWKVDSKEVKMVWEKHRRQVLHGDAQE